MEMSEFRKEFLILFRKYRRLGYDEFTARYLAYRDMKKIRSKYY
jgi:hypothetical protein